ncbi:DNA repair and recombination protein RAD54B-like isoform X3 [Corticium candelabrum]|uniref:DNA repair and recombination protein RAD54B-like isoform X3 n=1 Tax=Corticium candelabrum TaxID=121492 RepID=UPI002E27279E|nr:DNA repair and recombination protein RAD54B-like isoform X3 [Corticium candelabrum]
MRRSTAPSMVSTAKKPKFVTPFKLQSERANTAAGRVATESKSDIMKERGASGHQQFEIKGSLQKENISCEKRYYSVVWCKNSNKKHKKWEGDAVLIVESRTATLKDTEGKELSRSTGFRYSDLSGLEEGSTLIIGSKEIEVMQKLSAEDYMTGKCFVTGRLTESTKLVSAAAKLKQPPKPFTIRKGDPSKAAEIAANREPQLVTSRHDPKAVGALVMPRPSHAHQWEFNKKGLLLVDVVVDPHLSNQLRSHQRDGTVFLYECIMSMRPFSGQGAILADEMGLGKTLQCITLLWTLMKQGPYGGRPVVKKAVIITPSSLVKNWQQEFRKWLGSERLHVFAVTSDRRVEEFSHCLSPVMILSYEMFLRCHERIRDMRFDLIICDEGHRLKNACRKTSSAIMELPARRRIVLTGTPIQEMPATGYNEFQEVTAHYQLHEDTVIEDSGKLHVVVKMLKSLRQRGNERVVLVSNYTKTLDLLQRVCESLQYEFLRLDGSTPSNKRMPIVDHFNKKLGNDFVFLLSSKAGGVGLNLVGASYLILYDIDWNPANDLQVMARVWRDGQKNTVHIYRLLTTGTIEEKMFQRQLMKQGLSGTVMDTQNKTAKPQFSLEELRDLFSLRENTLCDTYDLICGRVRSKVVVMEGEGTCTKDQSVNALSALRPCQLAISDDISSLELTKTNNPVTELLNWRKVSSPQNELEIEDQVLSSCSNITFVFQNVT